MSLGIMLIKGVDLFLQNYVTGKYEKFEKRMREKKEQEHFKKTLEDFAEKFIGKHQNEIVATSQFADYIDRYNKIEIIFFPDTYFI